MEVAPTTSMSDVKRPPAVYTFAVLLLVTADHCNVHANPNTDPRGGRGFPILDTERWARS